MTILTELRRPRRSLPEVLRIELSSRDGRWAAVSRIAVGCSITVAIAMVFRIPQPTYMAYIVFAISKDDQGATAIAAAGVVASVTVAILITLGTLAHRHRGTGVTAAADDGSYLSRDVYRTDVCIGPDFLPCRIRDRIAAVRCR